MWEKDREKRIHRKFKVFAIYTILMISFFLPFVPIAKGEIKRCELNEKMLWFFLGSARGDVLECPRPSCGDYEQEAAKVLISHLLTKVSGEGLSKFIVYQISKDIILTSLFGELESKAIKIGEYKFKEALDKIREKFSKGTEKQWEIRGFSLGWKEIQGTIILTCFSSEKEDRPYAKLGEVLITFHSPNSMTIKEIIKELEKWSPEMRSKRPRIFLSPSPFVIYNPPSKLISKKKELEKYQDKQVRPFTLALIGTIYKGGEVIKYQWWEKTIAGPIVIFSEKTPTLKVAEPQIISSLRILEPPPYRVGQTITGEFSIKNIGTAPVTFDVLTIGGRLNSVCPEEKCPDFTWKENITLHPGEVYHYKGKLTLEAPGNYHFFTAYRTKDGWNTAIPTAQGVTNTVDIKVSTNGTSLLAIKAEPNKITAFVKDQHGNVVSDARYWLMDFKGREYGHGYTSQTGYLEINTEGLPEGEYTLHVEKESGFYGLFLTPIPYCDPYVRKIYITPGQGISLGTIIVHKWSKITAKVICEDPDAYQYNFMVIDEEWHSPDYYPKYPSHQGYVYCNSRFESYPLPDGVYRLGIGVYRGRALVDRKVIISGSDVDLGEIVIPKVQR